MRGSNQLVALSLTLMACSSAEPDERGEVDAYEPTTPEPSEAEGSGNRNVCEGASSFTVINGVKIRIPVHCRSFWIDMGDPPPDEAKAWHPAIPSPRPAER